MYNVNVLYNIIVSKLAYFISTPAQFLLIYFTLMTEDHYKFVLCFILFSTFLSVMSVNCLTAGLTLYKRINNKTPARCALASSRVCTEGSYLSVSAPVTCCHLLFQRVLALQQNRLRVHKS